MRLDELFAIVPLWLIRSAVFVFGLLWGSFLNVVIYRVPRELSVVHPPSHCPGCGKPIQPWDNVPVLAYVVLRGRARCCGVRMSPRYPLVELIGGFLSLAVFEVVVRALPDSMSVGRAAAIYGADFTLCLGLVAAAFIDAEHMFLPDRITLGGAVLGVATATLRGYTLRESLIGAVASYLAIYIPFDFLARGFFGRVAIARGDAKLFALSGAWFGWPGSVFILFVGSMHGALFILVTRLLGIQLRLPEAVRNDIAELEKLAESGDEEARKALEEDPLTADYEPFILRFFQRLFGIQPKPQDAAVEEEAKADETENEEELRHVPFGPFLILAMLELLFLGPWLRDQGLWNFW